jgi:hypothetical protein
LRTWLLLCPGSKWDKRKQLTTIHCESREI